jgi:hypothetical protein
MARRDQINQRIHSFNRNKELTRQLNNEEEGNGHDENDYHISSNSVKVDLIFQKNVADGKVFIKPKDKNSKSSLLHPVVTHEMLALKLEDYITVDGDPHKKKIFQNFMDGDVTCSCRLLSMLTLKSSSGDSFTIHCNGRTVRNKTTERSNQTTNAVFSTVEVQFSERVYDARVLGLVLLAGNTLSGPREFIFLVVFCMDKIGSMKERQKNIHDEVYGYLDLQGGQKDEMDIQVIEHECIIGPTCMIPLYRNSSRITELFCREEKLSDFTSKLHKKHWIFLKINIPERFSKAARWRDIESRIEMLQKQEVSSRKNTSGGRIFSTTEIQELVKYGLSDEDLKSIDDFQRANDREEVIEADAHDDDDDDDVDDNDDNDDDNVSFNDDCNGDNDI